MRIVHSEYVSPCSPRVLERWGHFVKQASDSTHTEHDIDGNDTEFHGTSETGLVQDSAKSEKTKIVEDAAIAEPSMRNTIKFDKLFEAFPKTLILVGDAERLIKEVKSLQLAMEKDGVDVTTEWLKDAVHDPLIIGKGWWDEKVQERAWTVISQWAKELRL